MLELYREHSDDEDKPHVRFLAVSFGVSEEGAGSGECAAAVGEK
jgi:hypothetical protein